LTRLNLLVSGTALVLAGFAFAAYDLFTFRDFVVRQLVAQAELMAANSEAAFDRSDHATATARLTTLARSRDILSAHLITETGQRVASFERAPGVPVPPDIAIPAGRLEHTLVTMRSVAVARRVVIRGTPRGTVVILSSLQSVYSRLRRYLLIVAVVLFASLYAALRVSRLAQRAISTPLVQLAAVARRVSNERDYSIRAPERPGLSYEVGSAIRSFNEMLGQVQARDRSLQAARDQLEDRVRRRTEELDVTNRELEAFSYSVSHDLRAPLRHVVGFATLLEQRAGGSLDDRARAYVKTITEAAQRMGRLIDDLLAFSRMGRASLTPEQVSLERLTSETKAEVELDAVGREIVWTIHPLPTVFADPALLRQVLVNLLSNAVKYSGTRSVAHIEVGSTPQPDGSALIHVRDDGVGFDMQYAGKLFGVFQRLHRADEFSGTGIGLATVQRIVQRHGGRVWAESGLDRGATFYVWLPPSPLRGFGATGPSVRPSNP
jgi:signal transduction histidine kinase